MDYDIGAADLASTAVLGRRRAQRERPQQCGSQEGVIDQHLGAGSSRQTTYLHRWSAKV
jgi:hypothetical protein